LLASILNFTLDKAQNYLFLKKIYHLTKINCPIMKNFFQPVENYKVPDTQIMQFISKVINWYFTPEIHGWENLDKDKPALYVSNHTLLGITDGPLYIPALYEKKDIFLRVLVDEMHEGVPVLRSILSDYGAVVGSRENCEKLMEQKQHILVFPGGTNEICKKKGDEYKLIWKERYGFARLAIINKYPIIPIAGLGGDELFDILIDKEDIMESKLGEWLRNSGIAEKYFKDGEHIPPLVKGIGPTLLPKPKKLYYLFGEPISTLEYEGKATPENLKELRKRTEMAIYDGLTNLRIIRAKEPEEEQGFLRSFLNSL
jgi:1-acyl-sn-glycerol-3-phosphate acyltransferase